MGALLDDDDDGKFKGREVVQSKMPETQELYKYLINTSTE